jgi:hypothetical protein
MMVYNHPRFLKNSQIGDNTMRSLRLLLVILSLSGSLLAAESPFSGTWKFNPTKGHPTPPIVKSQVVHVEADADAFKFSDEGVDDKDQPFKSSYEAKFDGKEYPITGDPNSDSVSLQRVNEREIKFTTKKAGKVAAKLDVIVSKDGKTTTVHYVDHSQGKPVKGSSVYDKQ